MRKLYSDKKIGLALLFSCIILSSWAQDSTKKERLIIAKPNMEKMFKPIVALEGWATYNNGEGKSGKEYANRADFMFRRFRFGGEGNPYSWLSYSFQLYLDRLGENNYASTKGSYAGIDIWTAYITAKLLKNNDLLNLHAGYFWSAVSREYNTSPWAVGSFDKTQACWYLRNFISGKGNGTEKGIGLGGLKNSGKFGISYRIGMYSPAAYISSIHSDPLLTGRLMFSFGDPEQDKYKYMLSGNQWRKRNGVTLGIGASTQANGQVSDTVLFSNSKTYGVDVLINLGGLRIDGEYFAMRREVNGYDDFEGTEFHARIGYNFVFKNTFIEPVFAYDKYDGEGIKALFKYIGNDETYDIGVNWYLDKDKLKLAVHYVIQDGTTSPNVGDYVGLAMQVRI